MKGITEYQPTSPVSPPYTYQTSYYDCYFSGPCVSIYEVCCYSGAASVRLLSETPGISECGETFGANCILVCGQDPSEVRIGCPDMNGASTPCCCGGGCPDAAGLCPEDPPCIDENGFPTIDRCCDGSCPELNVCPDAQGNLTRDRCCDGTCPDQVTGECL